MSRFSHSLRSLMSHLSDYINPYVYVCRVNVLKHFSFISFADFSALCRHKVEVLLSIIIISSLCELFLLLSH